MTLAKINSERTIREAVGESTLHEIVTDFLNLLETSCSVNEKNGDYALGIFESEWCRLLKSASFELCGTKDIRSALESGKWLCRESCWTNAAKIAVETGQPVDIKCNGGIRFYAQPILADGQVVGSINFGYDDPPSEPEKIKEIAAQYNVSVETLSLNAKKYISRPKLIIDQAKSRIAVSARLIGNIVELHQAKESLKKGKELLNEVGKIAKIGGWEMDLITGEAKWTRGTYDIVEIDQEEAVPGINEHLEYYMPEYRPIINEAMRKLIEENIPFDYEAQYLSAKGNYGWCRAIGRAEFQDGKCVKVFGTLQDITEKKALEMKGKEYSEMYGLLLEHSGLGIGYYDLEGNIRHFNKRAVDDLGGAPEDYIGKNVTEIFGKDSEEYLKRFKYVIQTGHSSVFEDYLDLPTGEKWFFTTFSTVMNAGGQPLGVQVISQDITQRKIAQLAIEESEFKFRNMAQVSPAGIYQTDSKGRSVFVNKRWMEMAGLTLEEAQSDEWIKALHPDDRDTILRKWKMMIASNGNLDEEYRFVNKKGVVTWIHGAASPIYSPVGKIQGYIGVNIDITDRKRIENELRISETRHRYLFRNMPNGVAVYEAINDGEDFIIKEFNDASEKIEQISRDELIGERLTEVFPGVDEFGFLEILRKVWKTGIPANFPMKLYSDKRISGWRENTIYRLPTGEVVAVYADVTEKVIREQEQRKLISLINNSREFIGLASLDGTVEYVNEAGLKMVGLPSLEVARKKKIFDFVSEKSQEVLVNDILPKMAINGFASGENKLLHFPTDKEIDIFYSVFLFKAEGTGEPTNIAFVASDISFLKSAEREKETLGEQLQQSQKMEAIGQLAGGVAHDFNNILTVISGFSEIIYDKLSRHDPIRSDVEQILKASDTAATLTKQLLAFSRKQIIDPKILNLNHIISQSEKMLQRLINENIEVIFKPADAVWSVQFDPGQIEQILVNLVVNAGDAMPDGGKLIIETQNVSLEKEPASDGSHCLSGEFILFAVSDTGQGIDVETQKKIFEPFFTTKEKGKGTGLGLSTVYGILQQNKSFINVYSEQGQGTTFKIYIPRIDAKAKKISVVEEQKDIHGNETILLVEDQEIVRTLALRVLHEYGYNVLACSDGDEALQAAKNHSGPIDLILTDVVMPKMSGKVLYEMLSDGISNARVLYMSGYTEEAIAHHGVLDQGTNFIQKPFMPRDLVQKIREMLDEKDD